MCEESYNFLSSMNIQSFTKHTNFLKKKDEEENSCFYL